MREIIRSYPFQTDFSGAMMAILTLFAISVGIWLYSKGSKDDNTIFGIGYFINRTCLVIGCIAISIFLINLFGWGVFEIEKIFRN